MNAERNVFDEKKWREDYYSLPIWKSLTTNDDYKTHTK